MRQLKNPLLRYMELEHYRQIDIMRILAKRTGRPVLSATVSSWVTGRTIPSPAMQLEIMRMTGKTVTPIEWCRYAVSRDR